MSKPALHGGVEMHIYMGGGGASEKCATIGCTVKNGSGDPWIHSAVKEA